MKSCITFELKGMIRSSGVRTFFWKIAAEAGLTGWITNAEGGAVSLRLEGTDLQISTFIRSLPSRVPGAFGLRSVMLVKRETDVPDEKCEPSFRILDQTGKLPDIPLDRAPCPDCIREMLSPASRRYCYPFFSCSKCGPAYSLLLRSPFVRRNTSMTAFPLCPDCRAEKENGGAHFRHSELLACPQCGPQFFLLDMYGDLVTDVHPLCEARESLKNGEILAVQSLYGGFQLFADAFNQETIRRLRRKRNQPDRPLSLMARNLEVIRKYCECSEAEAELLTSPAAPVVILTKKKDCSLPEIISPDTDTLAVGLPSSLPEILLFERLDSALYPASFDLLVTCGDNRPGKAECMDIDEIFNRLMAFTDKFLCHDLKTGYSCPPSVCQICNGRTIYYRRSRGCVPHQVKSGFRLNRNVAAFGCDAQVAVALGAGEKIVLSQAVGHLDGQAEAGVLQDMFERFTFLYDRAPEIIACDMDRESFSARIGSELADLHGLPLITVQTHHAHALACMAEHGLKHALALVMNSGSPGPDGTEWGSECLEAKLDGFRRLAAFSPAERLPGRPARLFLEYLIRNHADPSAALLERLGADPAEYELWKKQNHVPADLTSSPLRLINAVCAGIGIAPGFCTYPERCLLLLRKYASRFDRNGRVPDHISVQFRFKCVEDHDFRQIDWTETMLNLAKLRSVSEEEKVLYAEAFYDALAESMLAMSLFAESCAGLREIVLSGSLFQDPILLDKTCRRLEARSFRVFTHVHLSGNESCVPVGQAYAAGLADDSKS